MLVHKNGKHLLLLAGSTEMDIAATSGLSLILKRMTTTLLSVFCESYKNKTQISHSETHHVELYIFFRVFYL